MSVNIEEEKTENGGVGGVIKHSYQRVTLLRVSLSLSRL